MIGHLRGRLLTLSPEDAVLEVAGVGYALHIAVPTFAWLERRRGGGEVALFVHTHVREDALELFGFATEGERRLFRKLIAVSGIGPRLARVVLSGMSPEDLATALGRGDVARLSTIPGVGKKTAERMVVELRDKVAELRLGDGGPAAAEGEGELLAALTNLGYRRSEAERAVSEVRREHGDAPFAEQLRLALKRLARL